MQIKLFLNSLSNSIFIKLLTLSHLIKKNKMENLINDDLDLSSSDNESDNQSDNGSDSESGD